MQTKFWRHGELGDWLVKHEIGSLGSPHGEVLPHNRLVSGGKTLEPKENLL